MDTVCACASALPAELAVLRLSGPAAQTVAVQAGLALPAAWRVSDGDWKLGPGATPCRVVFAPAGRSYTGFDLIEIMIPGAPDLVELALAALHAAGAVAAGPGASTRQAVATGRIGLDRVAAVLAVSQAGDAAAAQRAVARLHGGLEMELMPVRNRLLELRALVEAGLDFIDEADVRAYEPSTLQAELGELAAVIARWRRAASDLDGVTTVALAGPPNAGKSALFARLTGASALVSAVAGTTRDWLQAEWQCAGRSIRLIDTAGWLADARSVDADAVTAGRRQLDGAALVLLCSAPDARLETIPDGLEHAVVVATKADLGAPDPRAVVALSAHSGDGLEALAGLVTARLAEAGDADPRQQRLLAEAQGILDGLTQALPEDLLLADDLATAADRLGDLLGVTTPDEVLGVIFGRFCIGK